MGRAHKFHHTSQRSVTAVHYTLANLEKWRNFTNVHAANNFQVEKILSPVVRRHRAMG